MAAVTKLTERELRFSKAKPARFAACVATYRGLVVGVCRRRLSDAADVEDAAQQTFVKLARSGGTIEGDAGAWLHRTATRTCSDLLRSKARRRRHESRVAAVNPPAEVSNPAALAEWAELSAAVDDAMDTLPAETRALLIDRFWLGRSQREMAVDRGVSASTVHTRTQSAVEALRRVLRRKGISMSAAALVSGLPALTVRAADVPTALAAACVSAGEAALPVTATVAASSVGGGAVSGFGFGAFAAAPLASTAALAVVGFLAAVSVTVALRSEPLQPMGGAGVPAPDVTELAEIYGLPADAPAGFFPPPFPPQRDDVAPKGRRIGPDGETPFTYAWITIHLTERWGPRRGGTTSSPDPTLEDVLTRGFEVPGRLLESLDNLAWTPGPGDWVIRTRPGMSTQEKLDAFAFVYEQQTGTPLRFEARTYERPHLILASPPDRGPIAETQNVYIGVVTTRPLSPDRHAELVRRLDAMDRGELPREPYPLTLHDRPVDRAEDNEWFNPWIGLSSVSEMLDVPVLQPVSENDPTLVYNEDLMNTRFLTPSGEAETLDHTAPDYRARLMRIVGVLQRQLGGEWRLEDRPVTVWRPVLGGGEEK